MVQCPGEALESFTRGSALAEAAPHPPPALSWAGLGGGGVSPSHPQLPSLSLAQPRQGSRGSVRELGSAASNWGAETGTLGRSGEELEVCTEGTGGTGGVCGRAAVGTHRERRGLCWGNGGSATGNRAVGGGGCLRRRSGGPQRRSGGPQQGRRVPSGVPEERRGAAAPSRGSHLLPGGGSQGLLQELPEPRVRGGGRDGAEGQGDGEQGQGALEAAGQHLAGGSGAGRRRRGGADGSAAARLRRWGSPRRPPPL